MINISLANKLCDMTDYNPNHHLEFLNYTLVLPFVYLFGIITCSICIIVFMNSKLNQNFIYKYLFIDSIFLFIIFTINFIKSVFLYLDEFQTVYSVRGLEYELYINNFACNVCFMISTFCKIFNLFQLYNSFNKKGKLKSRRFKLILVFIIIYSILCYLPVVLQHVVEIDSKLDKIFSNTYKGISFDIMKNHRFFLRSNKKELFMKFLNKNRIYKISGYDLMPDYVYDLYVMIIGTLNESISIMFLILLILILFIKMKNQRNQDKKCLCRSIENFRSIYMDKTIDLKNKVAQHEKSHRKSVKTVSINDFENETDLNSPIYPKENNLVNLNFKFREFVSTEPSSKEYKLKLVKMLIVINSILVLTRLLKSSYTILNKVYKIDLNTSRFIYYVFVVNFLIYFSNTINLFVYLIYDKKFRKIYEKIFKHICYFKIHLPKKKKTNFKF